MTHPLTRLLGASALANVFAASALAQSPERPSGDRYNDAPVFGGPGSVGEQLRANGFDSGYDAWNAWKELIDDRHGFKFNFEYSSLMQLYSEGEEDLAASGIFRAYGAWELLNRDAPTAGSLVWKVDSRHAYSDVAPQNAAFGAGANSITGSLYSDREWGLVNLQWNQPLGDGRGGFVVGWMPADDYFNTYALANILTDFQNLEFSVGAVTPIPDSGVGIAGGSMLGENMYFKAGLHDANGSSSDPDLDVFGDWELYKNLEVGWTPSYSDRYSQNVHVGVWHVDDREEAGVDDDWGLVFNANWTTDAGLMPFLRAGWADGEAALLDTLVAAGMAQRLRERDAIGIGLSWGSPAAPGLGDQWTGELYYRWQQRNLAITPSVQFIANPALAPDEDVLVLGGLRARIVY